MHVPSLLARVIGVGLLLAAPLPDLHGVPSSPEQVLVEQADADRKLPEITRAMERVYPALVRILVVTVHPDVGRLQKYETAGSGVIISSQGHVVTNHHVAGKARQIVCTMPDGEKIEASLLGTDALSDIAVLKLMLDCRRDPDKPLPVAVFGDSDRLRVGDTVLAMGSPAALSPSVTRGIVSNTRMIFPQFFWPFTFKLDGEEVGTLVRWIGHDARIWGGNSGGPLVNLDGEVVGINEIGIGSIGGAIPSNLVSDIAQQIIATGQVARSWVGLECQPRLTMSKEDRGVLVSGVIGDSPANSAGLRAGDIITSYDGVAVDCAIPEEMPVFNRLVVSTPIGKVVEVEALRSGRKRKFKLRTGSRDRARGKDQELRSWGVTARDFTLMSALEKLRPDSAGVFVYTLRPGGPSAEAKPALRPGDVIVEVNGRTVMNLEGLRRLSEELTAGSDSVVPVLVAFERHSERFLTVVRVGKEPPEESPAQARRAWLAATTQVFTRELAEALDMKGTTGVRVTQVYPGHEAGRAGLKVGDVIVKLDGEVITASRPDDSELFPTMIRQRRIGSEVKLELLRDKAPLELTVKLEPPPKAPSELERYRDEDFEFVAREPSFSDRIRAKLEPDLKGLMIDRVEMAGWAALAHVAVGDIILSVDGQPTPDIAALETAIGKAKKSKAQRVVFFVRRGIHTLYLELEPSWDDR